jgi:radical SAM-linked protein
MYRIRIKFSRGEEIKYISHLDIIRLWERVFNRACISLSYSGGFNPHPRLSLAAPLQVAVTSEAELMDVFLDKWSSPHWFYEVIRQQLPAGIKILGVYQIPLEKPSLQSQVRYAEYQVMLENEQDKQVIDIKSSIDTLLSLDTLPWHHHRDTGRRSYDLRALINDLWYIDWQNPYHTIGMKLRCDSGGSGRPEQVVSALGFNGFPASMHRTHLILTN